MKYKVFISSFLKFAAAAGLRRWLRFFVFAILFGGCTVQFQLPPATVTNLPDGGKVDVLPDSIPAMYSTRPRFYWEQIEKSDSTYSFAVTNGSKDGRWVRGDSMRWHTSGPFVTVMTDTVATRAYARAQGRMTTFDVRGDVGTAETVQDSDELYLRGQFGVNTSNSATDIINFEVDSSEVSTVYAVGDSLARRFRNVYQVEDYGAHVDTTDNSPKIQAAIDAAAANGGGIVKLTTPGVYTVESAGSSCYTNYACIIMKDSIDFVLGAGVTLKLANDQWNDTGTIRVAVISVCDASDFSISGGKIDGNASGQTTWTAGYEQAKAFGIQAYRCHSFEVRDMTIFNGLSNPINFHSCYEGEVVNMYSTGCGEGPEWQRCHNFAVRGYIHNDSTDVSVGDGFELSGCRRFTISGVQITENGLGAAFDFYGSTDISLNGFMVQNWNGVGISLNNPAEFRPLNISVSDGIIRGNRTQNGIQPNGDPGGSSTINNVVFDSLQFGLYMIGSSAGYTIADGCVFKSNLVGVRMECNDTLSLKSSLFVDNTYGVQFDTHPTYTQPVLSASDCDFMENGAAFYYSGDGTNAFTPKFYMDGLRLLNNTNEISYTSIAPNDTTTWLYGDYLVANQMKYGGYGRGDYNFSDHAFFITIDSAGNRQEMPVDSVANYLTISGDNWGSQVVVSDATLTGNGTASSPLSVAGGGGSGTDDQTLTYNGSGSLTIEDGNTVDMSDLLDNTDDQTIDALSLSGTTLSLSLENDGQAAQTVDLSALAVIDSTRLTQDSILVYYQDGAEVGRDTIAGTGGGGSGDGNGIFDVANDGATIPASFDAQITNTFSLTDGTNNLFQIDASNGHSAIGKGASTNGQYSLNINETQSYTSSSFGGIQIANVFNHSAGSLGGMVGFFSTPSITGAFAPAYMYGGSLSPNNSGSANLATLQGIRARPIHSGSGTVTSMAAVHAQLLETGSGDVVIGYGLNVDVNSGTFSNVYGVNVNDQTASTAVYGIRTGISSGSGKYNIYASGTADNYFRGKIGIGDGNTSPGADVDIAGDMILDGIFYDKDGDAGSAGDVLTSTGSATNWVSPQYAQSYNTGGANSSVTAGTPEQVISTTLGTTNTIAATSEFTVQSDADIQYTGGDNAVIKITAEAAIDPANGVYALYYIAINGVVQNSSRFRVYSSGASIQPMSVNITFFDTDADNGDTYSLYVDQTVGTNGYTVYDFRLTAEKIK